MCKKHLIFAGDFCLSLEISRDREMKDKAGPLPRKTQRLEPEIDGSQYFLLFVHFQVNHVLFSRLYIPRILEKVYSTETSSGGCSRGEDCKFSHERPANVEK